MRMITIDDLSKDTRFPKKKLLYFIYMLIYYFQDAVGPEKFDEVMDNFTLPEQNEIYSLICHFEEDILEPIPDFDEFEGKGGDI